MEAAAAEMGWMNRERRRARGQVMALLARDMQYGINTPGEGGGEDQDKARILEYYKYNAFGSVTVLPVYDRDDTSASSVNSSGVFDSGIDDIPGSGSRTGWDQVELRNKALGRGPMSLWSRFPLTLEDNNTLMTNRRNGDPQPTGSYIKRSMGTGGRIQLAFNGVNKPFDPSKLVVPPISTQAVGATSSTSGVQPFWRFVYHEMGHGLQSAFGALPIEGEDANKDEPKIDVKSNIEPLKEAKVGQLLDDIQGPLPRTANVAIRSLEAKNALKFWAEFFNVLWNENDVAADL